MEKYASSELGGQGRKKKSSISQSKLNDIFYVKSLANVDTTKWIAKDVPVDLNRLISESKL